MKTSLFLYPLLVLLLGIFSTFLLWNHYEFDEVKKSTLLKTAKIGKETSLALNNLNALSSYFQVVENIGPAEFDIFTQNLLSSNPAIKALEWIPKLKGQKARQSFEHFMQSKGYVDFKITEKDVTGKIVTSKTKPVYFPVGYVAPYQGNEKAHGFDLFSNKTRMTALLKAQDSASMVGTARIKLVQESGISYGFLIFLPVYKKDTRLIQRNERESLLKGFVLVVINITHLIKSALDNYTDSYSTYLYDTSHKNKIEVLYPFQKKSSQSISSLDNLRKSAGNRNFFEQNIHIAHRKWKIVVIDETNFFTSPNFWVFLTGVILSMFSALLVYSHLCIRERSTHINDLNHQLNNLNQSLEYQVNTKGKDLEKRNTELKINELELQQQRKIAFSLMEDARINERKAKFSEARVKSIIQSATDAIIITDELGGIVDLNQASLELFQYSRQELLGSNVKKLMPEAYSKEHDNYLKNYRNTGIRKMIGFGREIEAKKKDGTIFPIYLSISEAKTQKERLFTGLIRDISLQKQHEKNLELKRIELEKTNSELSRSNAELEQFAYVASHDLQAPLRHIASYTDMIKKHFQSSSDERSTRWFGFIIEGTTRMQQLTNDLLEYSRVGNKQKDFSLVDINREVANTIQMLKVQIEACNAELHHTPLPTLQVNKLQIAQLFQNLISNAIKYKKKDVAPQISIHAEEQKTHWLFYIKDNGIGMEAEYFDRIFLIFQRLHGKDEYSGTGIGLAICKKIIEAHGGRIWVESKINQGTTFYFTIAKEEFVAMQKKS